MEQKADSRIDQCLNDIQKYKKWGKLVNVTSAASLNEIVSRKKINDFIDICETYQMQNYAEVAKQIHDRGNVKVVLIAGPSSSGKTTSAFKMALQLRAIGYTPKTISLDSYYVGRDRNPKDENGNYDYECLEALDVELLNQNLIVHRCLMRNWSAVSNGQLTINN